LISDAATNRYLDEIIRWSDVRRIQSLHRLREREGSGEIAQLLGEADEIIKRLENEKRQLQKERNSARKEADRALNLSKSWRLAYQNVAQDDGQDGQIDPDRPPATVTEAVMQIRAKYGKDTDIASIRIPKSVRNTITDEFADPESVFDALEWLATDFVEAKAGRNSCPDLDRSCREASGFWYSPHQSKVTMGKYESDYHIHWQGSKQVLKAHLGRGSGKDPRQTIRIAFFYSADHECAVTGFIGQHQTTDAT